MSIAEGQPAGSAQATQALSGLQMKLQEGSAAILGADSLRVNGRNFPLDCVGVVQAVYWYAGVDLSRNTARYPGNGVNKLYRSLAEERQLIPQPQGDSDAVPGESPRGRPWPPLYPGDIIFWDNTYDSNGDGEFNDLLTHMGMVVYVLEGGTIEYIHYNDNRGIVLERMNLSAANARTREVENYTILINSPIRARNSPPAPGNVSLSSQLIHGVGRPWR
jgi:hypothetical protein